MKKTKSRKHGNKKRVRASKVRRRPEMLRGTNAARLSGDIKLIAGRLAHDYAGTDWDSEMGGETAGALRRIVG